MNSPQRQTIKILRKQAKILGKSPGRRDVPFRAYRLCVTHFGSWNEAKKRAGLYVQRRSPCSLLPSKSYEKDKDLAAIVSYLTFDGHLYKNLKGFYLSMGSAKDLDPFRKLILQKLDIEEKRIERYTSLYGTSWRILYLNSNATKYLNSIGVPAGDKAVTPFYIPKWIRADKEFSREYLKIAFFCEGHALSRGKRKSFQFNQNKAEKFFGNGLKFLEEVKRMLKRYGIKVGKVTITEGNFRKDGNKTKTFRIRTSALSEEQFKKEIGWLK